MSRIRTIPSLESMLESMAADQAAATRAAESHPIKVEDLKHDDYVVSVRSDLGVIIFAQVIVDMADEEDAEAVALSRQNGYVFTRAYSPLCPAGELGDIHVTRIHGKVSKELFERARANGWRHAKAAN